VKIAISSTGETMEAQVSPVFGRCPVYLFVDTETMQYEAVPNPALSAPGGAGIQAAQFIVSRGAQAVLGGNIGPNALQVFVAAGVSVYSIDRGTARQAVKSFRSGRLAQVSGATAGPNAGMGRRGGSGMALPSSAVPSPGAAEASTARQEEIATLEEQLRVLRKGLADISERLGDLS